MAVKTTLPPFVRGDTWIQKVTITGEDITGWTFWLTLKLDPTATDVNADAQVSVVASGADAAAGIVYITFTAGDTEDLLPTTYNYDIQYLDLAGAVQTLTYGTVTVIQDITRSRV